MALVLTLTPNIPSDMIIYEGAAFPQWRDNFFLGARTAVLETDISESNTVADRVD